MEAMETGVQLDGAIALSKLTERPARESRYGVILEARPLITRCRPSLSALKASATMRTTFLFGRGRI
jgi:hypothetical protein